MFVSLFFGYFYSILKETPLEQGNKVKWFSMYQAKMYTFLVRLRKKKNLVEDDGTLLDKNNT